VIRSIPHIEIATVIQAKIMLRKVTARLIKLSHRFVVFQFLIADFVQAVRFKSMENI
jgi:hypothetical protein